MTERAQEPGRSHHRLVIGPWEHCNYVMSLSTNRTGDVEFGPTAAAGVGVSGPLVLDWFDRWVQGRDTGPAGACATGRSGVDLWREAERWPPPHTEQRWFLRAGGELATEPPAGDEPPDTYTYDPADPTPTVGDKTLMPTIQLAGIKDRAAVEERPDVVCYTSAAVRRPARACGPDPGGAVGDVVARSTPTSPPTGRRRPDGFCAGLPTASCGPATGSR